MPRNWRSRTLGIVGVGALVVGAALVVSSPANAAPVADADALRQAVTALNAPGPAAEIELLPGVTYSLPGSAGCKDEDNNASGDLDIRRSGPLKIFTPDGKAPAVLDMTCDAEKNPQRVIQVFGDGGAPGKLTLRNVVIRNGHAPNRSDGANIGGGVLSTGPIAVENSVFENNAAGNGVGDGASDEGTGGFGGAILTLGAVTIEGSTFTGNRAGNGSAGPKGEGDNCTGGAGGHGGQGGAVFTLGGLTITNSTFSGNSAGSGGNGGDGCGPTSGVGGIGGLGGSGGAVQCGALVPTSREQSEIPCTGPVTVRGSTFAGNLAGNGGNGGNAGKGGIGGTGGFGGAILFLGRSTGAAPTTMTVENSTVDGNSSGNGGSGGNGVDGGNGGRGGQAGAIAATFVGRSDVNLVTLTHVTITENGGGGAGGAAGAGSGGDDAVAAAAGRNGIPGGGSLHIRNPWTSVSTVVGTSSAATDGPDCWAPATNATFSRSTDADVDGGSGCGFGAGSVLPFGGFALGALADNGGPTRTRLPAAASTLVDKVTGVSGQVTGDQRGVIRPQAAGADIGAVELQLIDLAVTKTASAASVAAGTAVTFTITVKNSGTSSPKPGVTLDDPNCTGLTAPAGDTNTNTTLDPGETFSYTCTATPTEAGTFTNTATATVTDGAGVKITRTASVDVAVTGAASTPPLAKTGANNPTPELMIGAWLIAGGVVLVLFSRPRRIRVRASGR